MLLVVAGLGLAGCDSGPSTEAPGGVIAPAASQVNFTVQPTATQSDTLTVEYEGLSERPRPESSTLPDEYAVELVDEAGTPDDGTSAFRVSFTGPDATGGYTTPVRFRAGGVSAAVRLVGTVLRIEAVADFQEDTEGFSGFGGPSVSQNQGALRVSGTNLGGEGVFPGVAKTYDDAVTPVDYSDTGVVKVRMKVTEASEGPAVVRWALNGAGDNPDANVTVDALVKQVPADGEYDTYYFDFRGNFEQFDGAEVDPARIGEVVFLINDNRPETFTGTIVIDEVVRRTNIPTDDR